jgi:hypothetical protein
MKKITLISLLVMFPAFVHAGVHIGKPRVAPNKQIRITKVNQQHLMKSKSDGLHRMATTNKKKKSDKK